MKCRIAFVGGGNPRTLGVIHDWALQGRIAQGSKVCVMDIDKRRADVISALARQMPEMKDTAIGVTGTSDLAEALDGADFVYNVIRVGGIGAMEQDKRIGLKYGYHGHDDFGPSAAMIALRTIPVLLDIAGEMTRRCPNAWLLNFTNPVPLLVNSDLTRSDGASQFSERTFATGSIGPVPATSVMMLTLAHAGKLQKFGP